MKRPLPLIVCVIYGFLALPLAHAQTNNNPLDRHTLQSQKPSKLAQFSRKSGFSTQKKLPARLISPNIKQGVKNNLANPPSDVIQWHKHLGTEGDGAFAPRTGDPFASRNLNAGSVDPHIFYAPNEAATPSGIVIKPLKEIDPEMVINPDEQPIKFRTP